MKKNNSWYFLLFMIFVYLILFFVNSDIFWSSFTFFKEVLIKVLPIFVFVFILMVIINKYVDNQFILKHIRGNKIKVWFYIIVGGIISTGPMYMWYPLLKDLKKAGINDGEIAAFLYSRSIKPMFLPIMVFYFGFKYVAVLSVVTVFMSFAQAFIINRFNFSDNFEAK